MPRKMRNPKARIEGISDTALWVMGDRVLYPEPAEITKWELIASPSLDYPTCSFDACKALWDSAKEQILADWIQEFPGSRPSFWWLYDAPRMSAEDIEKGGWTGCFFVRYLPDPRRRLSGVGTPAHELENLVAEFPLGIPEDFRDSDAHNPPKFESQSSYLRRHNLLEPGEERRLSAADFEPEIVQLENEESNVVPRPESPGIQ